MTKNYFRRFVWSFLALLGVTVSALAVKGVVGNSLQTNEAERTVLYSWEGNADGAIESGGTSTATTVGDVTDKNTNDVVDAAGADLTSADINMVNSTYRVIRLRGAKDFSTYVINVALDKELKAGDSIAITGYRNKNAADKQTGALIKFEKGTATATTVDADGLNGCEFVNIDTSDASAEDKNRGTEPNTVKVLVPESAEGSKSFTMTRAVTATNLFITKIEVISYRDAEAAGGEGNEGGEGGEGSGEGTSASFRDFSVNLVDILTADQKVEKQAQDMYVAVAEDGTVSQTDAAEVATNVVHLVGTYWNDHGWTGTTATVKVDGPVAITLGRCGYGGGDIIVKNADGETVAQGAFENAGSGNYCYSAGKPENSTTVKYDGEATTLTITYPSYLPYIAVASYDPSKEWKWRDLSIDMVNGALIAEQRVDGTSYKFGLVADDEGNLTQVDATADYANIVLDGKYHNSHGWTGTKATFKVEGPVEVSLGNCYYGSGTATLKNAAGEQVASVSLVKENTCWDQDHSSVVTMKYTGEATTLTLEYNSYLPYIGVKAVEATAVNVTYSLEGVECEGALLTTGGVYAAGDTYKVQGKNTSLYKEGYTLTGWTDGTNVYTLGQDITLGEEDITLKPVFTENTVTLADRTEVTTVKFPVCVNEGSQKFNGSGFTVGQATIGDTFIDVKAVIDVAAGTTAKFAYNKDEWTQVGAGTKITVPSYKGAKISLTSYQAFGADGKTATTIDGQSDYTSGTSVSYTVANTAETVDIVFGDDAGYVTGNIVVVLPVPEQAFVPTVFDNTDATVTWSMSDYSTYATPSNINPAEAFSLCTVALNATGSGLEAPTAGENSGVNMLKIVSAGSGSSAEFVVKPYKGVTFKATRVSAKIARFGTDGGTLTISVKNSDGVTKTLAENLIPARNNKTKADDAHGSEANYATNFDIALPSDIDFSTTGEFTLVVTESGLGSGKSWGIADVNVYGTVNGETEDVAKYSLAANVNDEAAGSVNIYPVAETYEQGTEVRLTATENFGYDFVNWTNAAGDEVSSEPVFTLAMTADSVLTANFVQVNTYELKLNVDGANDYMVKVNPAPTVVDGKNMYEQGTGVQLTADSYEGLVAFNNWNDGQTNSNKTILMNEDQEYTAFYADNDIIAGWDFYKAGNGGRKADYADEDNDAVVLNLVNTDDATDIKSWLDKSTVAAGGYETFKGAAVNWTAGSSKGDVGYYHWQTKVNAQNYTDINVQFQMLYNFNAYQRYIAEYSLNGTDWTSFGSLSMTRRTVASFSQTLPEACNNQAEVYIRMRADKTSNVDPVGESAGSAWSANDGNTLAMFFITGTAKIVDDGVAPVLVSQVPTDGAEGASATGKIVLTFDEKVKVADGTVAQLNGMELTPVVSGKTVTFEYKGLEYSTNYTFTLAANSIADLTDNYMTEAITINFTTMTRPVVAKQLYDFVVPEDGTFKEALNAAATRADKSKRYRIFVKKGDYVIPGGDVITAGTGYDSGDGKEYADPRTYFNSPNVSIIGEDPESTSITNSITDASRNPNAKNANALEGIRTSGVLYLQSGCSDTYFQDIKLWSNTSDATGRNVVLVDGGNRTVCKNVTLWAYQDTYVSDKSSGLFYFEGGLLRGCTDYICGSGDIFFNGVTLQMCKGGYITAARDNVKYGYVFKDCTIKGDASDADGNYYLGRPWTTAAEVYFIDTKMEAVPTGAGWHAWGDGKGGFSRGAEYNSMTASGSVIDLSARATMVGDFENNPVLTAEEALEIGNLHNMYGDWDPTLLTEQAPQVKNVVLDGNTITWDDSDYALLYAVVKNGSVVAFTTENSFDISTVDTSAGAKAGAGVADEADIWAVRAANEMGGLNEAVPATEATAVSEVEAATVKAVANGKVYNVAGQEVSDSYKGIVIIDGKKIVK
ncbi:MAG: Ig-like domain-containing protein [Prevotella sp.]|nr:Ig-like domain-containing protein [Prevotella sp.]